MQIANQPRSDPVEQLPPLLAAHRRQYLAQRYSGPAPRFMPPPTPARWRTLRAALPITAAASLSLLLTLSWLEGPGPSRGWKPQLPQFAMPARPKPVRLDYRLATRQLLPEVDMPPRVRPPKRPSRARLL